MCFLTLPAKGKKVLESKKEKKETEGRGNTLPTVSLIVANVNCGQFWYRTVLMVVSFCGEQFCWWPVWKVRKKRKRQRGEER